MLSGQLSLYIWQNFWGEGARSHCVVQNGIWLLAPLICFLTFLLVGIIGSSHCTALTLQKSSFIHLPIYLFVYMWVLAFLCYIAHLKVSEHLLEVLPFIMWLLGTELELSDLMVCNSCLRQLILHLMEYIAIRDFAK